MVKHIGNISGQTMQHVQMLCLSMWASGLVSEFYLESAMFWQPAPTSVPSSIALSTPKASIHRQADNSINHYCEEILALLGKKLKGLEPFYQKLVSRVQLFEKSLLLLLFFGQEFCS